MKRILLVFLFATTFNALEAESQESSPSYSLASLRRESMARSPLGDKRIDRFWPLDEKEQDSTKSSEKRGKMDWVDKWNATARWTKRGAASVDFATTWAFLSTSDYRSGKIYLKGNPASASEVRALLTWLKTQNYSGGATLWAGSFSLHQLPTGLEPPSEKNIWRYFGGGRSKPGVLISYTIGNIGLEFLYEKGYRYFSKQKGWRRHLRILIPLARSYATFDHIRGATHGVTARSRYSRWTSGFGLPHKRLPTAEEWLEKHPRP